MHCPEYMTECKIKENTEPRLTKEMYYVIFVLLFTLLGKSLTNYHPNTIKECQFSSGSVTSSAIRKSISNSAEKRRKPPASSYYASGSAGFFAASVASVASLKNSPSIAATAAVS